MTGRGRAALGFALGALLLSGCVQVPVTGPVQPIEGQAPPCQNCVNIEVAPPAAGDQPRQVVEGYLRATSIYQPNYAVAKQFLTRTAAEKWSPEDGAQIFRGNLEAGPSTVVLNGVRVGLLGPDRTYTAASSALNVNFGLVREEGEWRISSPPPGLMVAEYSFDHFYRSYNIYFVGNLSNLVPDPIYLPNLPNQANVASVLMKTLLSGPSRWLKPSVTSAIPDDTTLSVDSVTVQDGVAEVPLSDEVMALSDRRRSLLAAQVVYTLKQATGVKGVLFTVNGQPFQVPESQQDTLAVPVDAISPDLDPVPVGAGDQLYAVREKTVDLLDANTGSPNPRPMAGPLGQGRFDVHSLAVSVANTDVAVVTDDRTVLRSGLTTTGDPRARLTGVQNLLRPQFSRYNELWAIGESEGRQRIWMISGDTVRSVPAPFLADGKVTAFKISPDGVRMALIRSVGARTELGVARISRGDQVTVGGWRALEVAAGANAALTKMADVAWADATDLVVLGATSSTGSLLPYQLSEDASQITPPTEASNADAVELGRDA